MANLFDGLPGRLIAGVMAKANREAEVEAVSRLAPSPTDLVLVVGFGPGVGVKLLAERLTSGRIVGLDPSRAMVRAATRANRAGVASGKVTLHATTAEAATLEAEAFDGAVAVNALQLCEPLARTAQALASAMKPGALLVSLTHDWALARHAGSVEAWTAMAYEAFLRADFGEIESRRGEAENGRIVVFTARRA
ncbi:MAG: methyltransferase domain-containing protein [Caulobacteraceae bacterium]